MTLGGKFGTPSLSVTTSTSTYIFDISLIQLDVNPRDVSFDLWLN